MTLRSPAEVLNQIESRPRFSRDGRVRRVVGLVVHAVGLEGVALGELCQIVSGDGRTRVLADVVGFEDHESLLMPYGDLVGINPGAAVRALGRSSDVGVGDGLLGRILNGMGDPMDGLGAVPTVERRPLQASAPNPLTRKRIHQPMETGVRALDGILTIGKGQRMGIFAGAGVGKSVLLGMIARNSEADINVIALLGERGREVREFIERDLGPEGLARSVLVVATGEEAALVRARGALVATAIAEYFRDQGKNVLLMVDSITRVCMARREIGLAVGEAPARGGYPPSALSDLPRLLERAGNSEKGSITGIYTVLVDGDDFSEPVSDAARSVLDGHVILSRKLAAGQHFPAIDLLESKSRVRDDIIEDGHRVAADTLIRIEAAYRDHEDLISIGAYKPNTNLDVDAARAFREEYLGFLRQRPEEATSFQQTQQGLHAFETKIRSFILQRRGGSR